MNTKTINEEDVEVLRRLKCSDQQLRKLKKLVRKLDGRTARDYTARVFINCLKQKVPFSKIRRAVRKQWKNVWSKGTPGRLGDPDDVSPTGAGLRNTAAYFQVYFELGLSRPKGLYT